MSRRSRRTLKDDIEEGEDVMAEGRFDSTSTWQDLEREALSVWVDDRDDRDKVVDKKLLKAVMSRDRRKLQTIGSKKRGFVTDTIRRMVWPVVTETDVIETSPRPGAEVIESPSLLPAGVPGREPQPEKIPSIRVGGAANLIAGSTDHSDHEDPDPESLLLLLPGISRHLHHLPPHPGRRDGLSRSQQNIYHPFEGIHAAVDGANLCPAGDHPALTS